MFWRPGIFFANTRGSADMDGDSFFVPRAVGIWGGPMMPFSQIFFPQVFLDYFLMLFKRFCCNVQFMLLLRNVGLGVHGSLFYENQVSLR